MIYDIFIVKISIWVNNKVEINGKPTFLNLKPYNRDTISDIRGSPQCGTTPSPPEKLPSPSFIIIQQMKGYNLQHTHCNFLFFLSQYPHSEYNIHNDT
jgi:hypothetical protein